ncbi:hypothetical protein LCGC14_1419390, partial [marine sediment metagenome]
GGPKINVASPDFIPKKTVVKYIAIPHDDLLRWEKEAKAFKPGTVVYGSGYTLASHAAIHCVLNKVPFITSRVPKIGETLVQTQKRNRNDLKRVQFKRGVQAGMDICKPSDEKGMEKLFYFSLSVLHNWAYLKDSQHADWLLGAASIIFTKLCSALALGEHRHLAISKFGRSQIYEQVMKENTVSLHKLSTVFENFYQKRWGSGYGGLPWAICAWFSYLLWQQVVKMYNRSGTNLTDKEIADIITIINRTTNLAHNNGWWFNKFTSKKDFDFISKNSGLAAFGVADVFFDVHNKIGEVKSVTKKLRKPKAIKAPFYTDKDGKIEWLLIRDSYSKRVDIRLRSESGQEMYKDIKLSKREKIFLERKFVKAHRSRYNGIVLSVKNGKFNVPGGKVRDIRKVFGVA